MFVMDAINNRIAITAITGMPFEALVMFSNTRVHIYDRRHAGAAVFRCLHILAIVNVIQSAGQSTVWAKVKSPQVFRPPCSSVQR